MVNINTREIIETVKQIENLQGKLQHLVGFSNFVPAQRTRRAEHRRLRPTGLRRRWMQKYTPEEDALIMQSTPRLSPQDLARKLNRTLGAIYARRFALSQRDR